MAEQLTREERRKINAEKALKKVQRATTQNGIRFTFPTVASANDLDFTRDLRRGVEKVAKG